MQYYGITLEVNQIITVSSIEIFAAFVLCIGFEGQTINRKRHTAKLQNSNQNSKFWVSLIGLQELRF